MPSTSVTVSKTSDTAPVPRDRYQSERSPSAPIVAVVTPPPRASRRPSGPRHRAARVARGGAPGRPAGAAGPQRDRGGLATFAWTQVLAATVTVRHTIGQGATVAGSRMDARPGPPRRQRRTVVLEVARPPPASAITGPLGPHGHRRVRPANPGRRRSADGDVAAKAEHDAVPVAEAAAAAPRSAASAFAVAPGRAGRRRARARSGGAVQHDAAPVRTRRPPVRQRQPVGRDVGQIAVVPDTPTRRRRSDRPPRQWRARPRPQPRAPRTAAG